ncbi:hypothetical protein BKP56_06950 [Marinilactibacillus sp. 15R]|uniref:DUF739 family protein n=1 Tax=Marinilactibacillus TaxID=191769 RepID=UPI000909DC79|nr:DUF739 family protein [Marinilactibacillus sp. 15R]API89007.1 hypothetical protein BKP56_06950 [Marinilactibacillus sp. 15R]
MKDNITFDYSKLEGRIKEKFDSQQNVSDQLSFSKTSLSMKLNNRVSFGQKDILELAKVLEIPDNEIAKYFFEVKVRKTVQKEKV